MCIQVFLGTQLRVEFYLTNLVIEYLSIVIEFVDLELKISAQKKHGLFMIK